MGQLNIHISEGSDLGERLAAAAAELGTTPNGLAREILEDHLDVHLSLSQALNAAREREMAKMREAARIVNQQQLDEMLRDGLIINGAWASAHGLAINAELAGEPEQLDDARLAELVAPVLEETGGRLITREQILGILMAVGGLSLAETDAARKAISKRQGAKVDALGAAFVRAAVERGVSESAAADLFERRLRWM